MQVVIVTEKPQSWHNRQLRDALVSSGVAYTFRSISELGVPLGKGMELPAGLQPEDLILVRNIPAGSLEQIILRMDVLHHMEERGIVVCNRPGAIEKAVDKFYTSSRLSLHGIPTPLTFAGERAADGLAFFRKEKDIVLKPLFGSAGRGVVRITSENEAIRALGEKEDAGEGIYLQRYLEHGLEDLRLLVAGGKLIASMKRMGASWVSNISCGGKPKSYFPDYEIEKMAIRSLEVLGLDYGGVDIVICDEKPYVIEVNSSPGWKGLQAATGIEVAGVLLGILLGGLRAGKHENTVAGM